MVNGKCVVLRESELTVHLEEAERDLQAVPIRAKAFLYRQISDPTWRVRRTSDIKLYDRVAGIEEETMASTS